MVAAGCRGPPSKPKHSPKPLCLWGVADVGDPEKEEAERTWPSPFLLGIPVGQQKGLWDM